MWRQSPAENEFSGAFRTANKSVQFRFALGGFAPDSAFDTGFRI